MNETHFVAVGANLPSAHGAPALAACEQAVRAISALPYVRNATRSRFYSSAPRPVSDQPRYINGIVRVHGCVTPEKLLADLHHMEASAGRVRSGANAARVLDLDIIDMAGLCRDAPDPILPHPRAHLRAFVLLPLRDVAPHWVHPRLRLGIAALLAAVGEQDIFPL